MRPNRDSLKGSFERNVLGLVSRSGQAASSLFTVRNVTQTTPKKEFPQDKEMDFVQMKKKKTILHLSAFESKFALF